MDEVIRPMILQQQYRKRNVSVDVEDFQDFSRAVSTEDALSHLVHGFSNRSKRSMPIVYTEDAMNDLMRRSSNRPKRSLLSLLGASPHLRGQQPADRAN